VDGLGGEPAPPDSARPQARRLRAGRGRSARERRSTCSGRGSIGAPPCNGLLQVSETLLLLGAVQLGVSYWLYARAIRHVTALEAVLIPVIEPLLNPFWVLLALGERPSLQALAGGAIVLAAITLRGVFALRARQMGATS
jgi:hypothetical protein